MAHHMNTRCVRVMVVLICVVITGLSVALGGCSRSRRESAEVGEPAIPVAPAPAGQLAEPPAAEPALAEASEAKAELAAREPEKPEKPEASPDAPEPPKTPTRQAETTPPAAKKPPPTPPADQAASATPSSQEKPEKPPAAEAPAGAGAQAEKPKGTVLVGKAEVVSYVPDPSKVPYDTCVTFIKYRVENVESGQYDGNEVLAVMWGMRDGKLQPAARFQVGQRHRLRIQPFSERQDLARVMQADDTNEYSLPPQWVTDYSSP